jgi:hypothetical protein
MGHPCWFIDPSPSGWRILALTFAVRGSANGKLLAAAAGTTLSRREVLITPLTNRELRTASPSPHQPVPT